VSASVLPIHEGNKGLVTYGDALRKGLGGVLM